LAGVDTEDAIKKYENKITDQGKQGKLAFLVNQ
jgi:hypothetical protein